MQVKKNEIKEKIIEAAKKEFLEKGFEKASIRTIASRAGLTKGSIYTYFESKDALFSSIVEPALNEILHMLDVSYANPYKDVRFEDLYKLEYSVADLKRHVVIIQGFRESMQLLFFASAGSLLEGYKESIIQAYEKSTRAFYEVVGQVNPHLNTEVSELFIHTCALLYMGLLEEILIHEPNEPTLIQFIHEMATFVHFGIESVLKTPK